MLEGPDRLCSEMLFKMQMARAHCVRTSALLFMMALIEVDLLFCETVSVKPAAEFLWICVALADFSGYP